MLLLSNISLKIVYSHRLLLVFLRMLGLFVGALESPLPLFRNLKIRQPLNRFS